jgi:rhamnosyltransferase
VNKRLPKVAVLLATYNGESFVESQLNSILSQRSVDLNVYIRDDGSNDSTIQIASKYLSDSKVNYVQDDYPREGTAGNFFRLLDNIEISDFDYVSFSDQDDIWFPEKLANAIDFMQANSAELYSSNLIAFDNYKGASWFLNKCGNQKRFDYLFQGASAGCTYVLSCRAAVIVQQSLGDPAEKVWKGCSHDWLIYAICRSHKLKCVHDSRAFIAYRQHSVNAFGAMPGIRGLLQRLRLSKNGWYRDQILWHRQFLSQQPEETLILDAIERMNVQDRFYLVSKAWNLRRSARDCILISFVIMLGLL